MLLPGAQWPPLLAWYDACQAFVLSCLHAMLLPLPACSEPTSGLDARAAAIVMRAIQNVAKSNRTVMVTIHQVGVP